MFGYACQRKPSFSSRIWNVKRAFYTGDSFSFASQETSPRGLFVSSDGTKAYIVGNVNNTVYQYTLTIPWILSTGVYASKSFDVSSEDTGPQDIFFKTDGTKMYIVGNANNTIYQYSLTAWDVSTAVYDSKSFSVASQDTDPQDVFFSPDGTKMFALGNANNTVYQYTLSTGWDVSTASYDSKSFSVATQDTGPRGLFFRDNGKRMFVAGNSNDRIYQYRVLTAWDVSTAAYTGKRISIVNEDNLPNAIYFRLDGKFFSIAGAQNDRAYQYKII